MAVIDNVHLPEDIEAGALVGPMFSTTIVPLSGGNEQRNADWDQELLTADVSWGIMEKENAEDAEDSFMRLLSFFRARLGRHRGFLFRDVSDFEASREPIYINTRDRRLFQLTKRYDNYLRRLTRPRAETVTLTYIGTDIPRNGGAVNGVVFPAWRVADLGVITFDAALGIEVNELAATFEFDVPMRFESDTMQVAIEWERAGSIPGIKIVQDRE